MTRPRVVQILAIALLVPALVFAAAGRVTAKPKHPDFVWWPASKPSSVQKAQKRPLVKVAPRPSRKAP